jgi:glycosyltransferase involved in cell wall biosynthesis
MRIAYFAGSMRPGQDGVTRVLYRITTTLSAERVNHIFISPDLPSPEERTVPMIEVPSCTFPLYREYRMASPDPRFFERHVLAFRPDILHIHSPCSLGHAAVQFGRRHHIPVVATYHTHFASYARYYNIRFLEPFGWTYLRCLYGGCEALLVPSVPIMDELQAHGFRRMYHLPHGVDTTAFGPEFRSHGWRMEHGIPRDHHMLLYAGRLVWEKDLRTLALAYERLRAIRSDVTLVLAGDGPIREELMSILPGAIFLGQLSGRSLAHAYASADAFVFPSTTETFGNVILEAMASGTVPVCARQGGAAGVIKDGVTGILCQPRDAEEMSRRIDLLLNDPQRRQAMAEAALAHARQQSWQSIIRRMLVIYSDVVTAYHSTRGRRRHAA